MRIVEDNPISVKWMSSSFGLTTVLASIIGIVIRPITGGTKKLDINKNLKYIIKKCQRGDNDGRISKTF